MVVGLVVVGGRWQRWATHLLQRQTTTQGLALAGGGGSKRLFFFLFSTTAKIGRWSWLLYVGGGSMGRLWVVQWKNVLLNCTKEHEINKVVRYIK